MREYDLETLRNEVAMVLQKNVLFSGTIQENLRWGDKNATDEEMRARLPPGTGGRVHPAVAGRL